MSIESSRMNTGLLWGAVSAAIKKISQTMSFTVNTVNSTVNTVVSSTVNKVVQVCDHFLENVAEGAKKLGREIPAHRDVSNFSSDPKFWETVFLSDLEYVFEKYASNEKKLLEYVAIWMQASYQGASKLSPPHLIALLCNKAKEMEDSSLKKRIFLEIARQMQFGQIRALFQIQKTLVIAKKNLQGGSKIAFQDVFSLLLGSVFLNFLPQIQAGKIRSNEQTFENDNATCLDKRGIYFDGINSCETYFSTEFLKEIQYVDSNYVIDGLFDLKNYFFNNTIFYPDSSRTVKVHHCYFKNSTIGRINNIEFSDVILKNVFFEKDSHIPTPQVSFANSSLVEISSKSDKLLKALHVHNVTNCKLNIFNNLPLPRNYIWNHWKFSDIKILNLSIENMNFAPFELVNIRKLSGIWKNVMLRGCIDQKNELFNRVPFLVLSLNVENVLIEDMIFDNVQFCEVSSKQMFKQQLQELGFTWGRNISILNLPDTKHQFSKPNFVKTVKNIVLVKDSLILVAGALVTVYTLSSNLKHFFWIK